MLPIAGAGASPVCDRDFEAPLFTLIGRSLSVLFAATEESAGLSEFELTLVPLSGSLAADDIEFAFVVVLVALSTLLPTEFATGEDGVDVAVFADNTSFVLLAGDRAGAVELVVSRGAACAGDAGVA
jgi:hypothetical protein